MINSLQHKGARWLTDRLMSVRQPLVTFPSKNFTHFAKTLNLTNIFENMHDLNVIILRAITTQQKRLTIRNKQLYYLPNSIEFLNWLVVLDIRSNNLTNLPNLPKTLEILNLGHNWFTTIPDSIILLTSLKSIILNINFYLFNPPFFFLIHLKYFSISHNQLTMLPESMCSMLNKLEYFNLGYNQLLMLPLNFGLLQNMKTLILHKNFLTRLPETFGQLNSLKYLDLAGNNLQLLPCNFKQLKLTEFYTEANPFTRYDLFPVIYEENILTLKEIVLRKLSHLGLINIGYRNLWLENIIGTKLWQSAGYCALCRQPFVTWWVEGVQFVERKQLIKSKKLEMNKKFSEILYPIRTLFCSYQCLKSSENCYALGVG
ncbi:Plant intracellular Ras-group-related LRR protein 1 [Schistosoma japonicum]|nr:Plant intracellular Ras-group-related LRR protein 1 [Schistosoma japonicum]